MTPHTYETIELIRALLESFITHPSHLEVGAKELSSGVYFIVRSHPHDMPKIIGKGGTHIKALAFLVDGIGKNIGNNYVLSIRDGTPCASPRPPDISPLLVRAYDPQPIAGLVGSLLLSLGIDALVEPLLTTDNPPLCYDLIISGINADLYAALIVPPDPADRDARTIIGSIGTLTRAAANKAGVRMQLVAHKP